MATQNYVSQKIRRINRKFREFSWRHWPKLSDRTTVSTRQGRFTIFTADQVIGRQLFLEGEFESAWVEAALQFLRTKGVIPPKGRGTVVDIGANIGIISIGMLRQGEFERAIAIEPDPNNFSLLKRNARQNRLESRYAAIHAAATDRVGESEFELSENNFGDHRVRIESDRSTQGSEDRYQESSRRTIRVPVDTVDGILGQLPIEFTREISLVWIDTQGHEGHIFLGGHELFDRNIPVVCEVWPYGIHRAGMSQSQFCDIVQERWSHYWILRQGNQLVSYPTSTLATLFAELRGDEFDNVIFTK